MDKNTLLAIGISAAILLVWNFLFPPPPPPEVSEAPPEEITLSRETSVEESAPPATAADIVPATAEVSDRLVSKEVVVETGNFRMLIDTRGAVAKSMQLKHYQHTKPRLTLSSWFPFLENVLGPDFHESITEGNRVEMLGGELDDARLFSFELENDPRLSNRFKDTVFSANQDEVLLTDADERATLTLTSPVVDGLQVVKKLHFHVEDYIIGYEIELINRDEKSRPLEVSHFFGEPRVGDEAKFRQIAHEGPVYFMDESLETIDSADVSKEEWDVSPKMQWMGVEDQYFINATAALTPVRHGVFGVETIPVDGDVRHVPYYGVRLPDVKSLEPQRLIESKFEVYLGPKSDEELLKFERNLIQSHDMTLETLAAPLLDLLRWIYRFVGNYGVAIIILTILVRLLLFPLTLKGMKSMKRMQQLAPRMKKLQEKYKNNKEKLNQEMMGMYRKNKVNPLGGCLPLVFQLPVFFALYSALSSAVELRHAPFLFWINDLSQPDGLGIAPLLMGISMYFQQKLTPQSAMMDQTQAKIMQMLPIIFTFFTFTFPAGLTIYWLTSNILSIGQQLVINRIKTPELQD